MQKYITPACRCDRIYNLGILCWSDPYRLSKKSHRRLRDRYTIPARASCDPFMAIRSIQSTSESSGLASRSIYHTSACVLRALHGGQIAIDYLRILNGGFALDISYQRVRLEIPSWRSDPYRIPMNSQCRLRSRYIIPALAS